MLGTGGSPGAQVGAQVSPRQVARVTVFPPNWAISKKDQSYIFGIRRLCDSILVSIYVCLVLLKLTVSFNFGLF